MVARQLDSLIQVIIEQGNKLLIIYLVLFLIVVFNSVYIWKVSRKSHVKSVKLILFLENVLLTGMLWVSSMIQVLFIDGLGQMYSNAYKTLLDACLGGAILCSVLCLVSLFAMVRGNKQKKNRDSLTGYKKDSNTN